MESFAGEFRRFFVAAGIVLFLTGAMVAIATAASAKKVSAGAVISWSGTVYIERSDGSKVKVERQETVYAGDTVLTEKSSKVKLLMKDDTVILLAGDSSFTVKGYDVDTVQSKRSVLVKVSKGLFRAKVNRFFGGTGASFSVESVTSVAGVKGTDFVVMYTDEGVKVLCLYGTVGVKSSDPAVAGEVELTGGKMTDVKQGQPPDESADITDEYLKKIADETNMNAVVIEEKPVIEEKVDTATQGQPDSPCFKCHENVFEALPSYAFGHPDASRSCAVCHILAPGKPVSFGVEHPIGLGMIVPEFKEGIFYDVTVTVDGGASEQALTKKVLFVPGAALESLPNDGAMPVISNVRITEVVAGMFFTAVVEWDTDKPARSKVNYGKTDKLGTIAKISGGDNIYLTSHRVKLDKLKPKEAYYMAVSSEDVFGNSVTSETTKFSADKPFANNESRKAAADAPGLEAGLFSAGTKVAFKWTSGIGAKTSVIIAESAIKPDDKPHYPGFKTGAEIGIDACNECHGGGSHKQTAHPVGPMKWGALKKNPNLPYDNLGNITCLTCHPGHGSEFGKMLRAEETPLCNSCHK